MTLVLAFVGSEGITVAADKKAYQGTEKGYVEYSWEKLTQLGNSMVLGCAGSPITHTMCKELNLTDQCLSISEYHKHLLKHYEEKKYSQPCSVLIAGFDYQGVAEIVTFELSTRNPKGPEHRPGFAAVGAHMELAMLLLKLWNEPALTVQEQKELAILIISLVAEIDPRVGTGIDLWFVRSTRGSVEKEEFPIDKNIVRSFSNLRRFLTDFRS